MAAADYHAGPAPGSVTDRESVTDDPEISRRPVSLNDRLAGSYRDMESAICGVAPTCNVFEIVMDHVLGRGDRKGELITFTMAVDEWNALFHQMYHVTNSARDLVQLYESGLENAG